MTRGHAAPWATLVRWAAALVFMMVAIVVAGLGQGELLSLTLAPLMLAALVALLVDKSKSNHQAAALRHSAGR